MNQKLIKQTSYVLSLINIFDFIQPNLNLQLILLQVRHFNRFQLISFSFDIDIQQEYSDNWEMQMKNLKELWHAFESKLTLQIKPNFLQIVRNQNEQCIMEMIVCLLQSMINSSYSSDLGTEMMQLDQETQIVLLKLLQEEQSLTNIDQDSKYQMMYLENLKSWKLKLKTQLRNTFTKIRI